jgi:hypothetical protein
MKTIIILEAVLLTLLHYIFKLLPICGHYMNKRLGEINFNLIKKKRLLNCAAQCCQANPGRTNEN